MRVVAVLDPLLLYELELPERLAFSAMKITPDRLCTSFYRADLRWRVPIGQAATGDAAPHQLAVRKAERIAG